MSHMNMLNKSGPNIQPWGNSESIVSKSYKVSPLLFFAYNYVNNFAVYLVNLCQVVTHVIWQSTNHDLSNQKPSKGQLSMHRKLYYCQ